MIIFLEKFIKECIYLWLEMAPYLLFGMSMAGLLHIFLGKEVISRQLGKPGLKSIVKATLLGIPLPICSCGVIPVVSALKKEGAHKSSLLSFLVSTPTTGVDSIFATYSLLGPLFAIFRPLAAMVSGITLGVLDYLIEGKNEPENTMRNHSHEKIKISFKWREFFRYSFYEIPQDIGKALVLGMILGGAISVFIPQTLFKNYFVFPFDFLIALLLGIPLYVCSTGSIPIAVSLILKGFSPGAGLVFLITGPATNAVTLSFVRTKMGKISFYLYLTNIITVSVILGLIFNHLWFSVVKNPRLLTGASQMLSMDIKIICGVILLILVGISSFQKKTCRIEKKSDLKIFVPDADCNHCKLSIESALTDLPGIDKIEVDINKKIIYIIGAPDRQTVIHKIRELGYSPQE
ncbi:MAG: permease [Candidatus Omnitrophota bacterium]